jgi:hypothetical protein
LRYHGSATLRGIEHRAGKRCEGCTLRCQLNNPTPAHYQRRCQIFLKLLDVLDNGRGRQFQIARCGTKSALAENREEGPSTDFPWNMSRDSTSG